MHHTAVAGQSARKDPGEASARGLVGKMQAVAAIYTDAAAAAVGVAFSTVCAQLLIVEAIRLLGLLQCGKAEYW